MPPLDALTQARIRSLEIVLAWLIAQSIESSEEGFAEASSSITYIMDLAEKISPEEEDD